jgi:hypothetical protein
VCNCEAIILYQASDLVSRPCHPEEAAGICATGQGLLNNCDICFETVSSRTCPEGTWVSITYLGESEITIITVGEGSATVTPVTVLEYDGTAPLEFEFTTVEWGDPVTLKAEQVPSESGEVTIPYFLYTAPEANLERIAAGAEELGIELPPPGVPQPADQLPSLLDSELGLPPVLEALEWSQPYLQSWIYELSISAFERGGIQFPPIEPPSEAQQVTLDFDGVQLADPRVQEAFVSAIDQEAVVGRAFPNQEVQFTAVIGKNPVKANTIPYNPNQAQALLDEAGFDRGQMIMVVFPEEDAQVALAGKLIAGDLSRMGIKVEPTPVPGADLPAIVKKLASGEQPVVAVYAPGPLSCTIEAVGEFAALWQSYRAQLGCPHYPTPKVIQDAEQAFDNGRMLWRADNRHIYVIYEQGARAGTYEFFLDEWKENDPQYPEYSCAATPPPDRLQPKRGFGLVWCKLGGPEAAIGWALEEEEGYSAGEGDPLPLVQDFASGVIFRDSAGMASGRAYVLLSSTNTFEHESY